MIPKTIIGVEVQGADRAAQQLKSVGAATQGVTDETKKADAAVKSAERAVESKTKADKAATAAMGESTSALKAAGSGLDTLTEGVGKALGKLNAVGDVFKVIGVGFAGGALFGGLQDIVETLGALHDKFVLATTSLEQMGTSAGLVNEKMLQSKLGVDNLSDGLDRYAKAMGLADSKAMSFLQHQEALRSIALGKTLDVEVETKKTEVEAQKLADLKKELEYAKSSYALNNPENLARLEAAIRTQEDITIAQDMTIRELKSDLAAANKPTLDFFAKAEAARVQQLKQAAEDAKASAVEARKAREEYDKAFLAWMTPTTSQRAVIKKMMDEADRRAQNRFATPIQNGGPWNLTPPGQQPVITGSNPRALSDLVWVGQSSEMHQREVEALSSIGQLAKESLIGKFRSATLGGDKEALDAAAKELADIKGRRTEVPGWGQTTGPQVVNAEQYAETMQSVPGKIGSAFTAMADPISAGIGMVTDAVSELTTQLGIATTNMFLAGESSQKSAKRIAGEMTAGLSAQAFSYAVLFGAMAAAFALMPPPFDAFAVPAGIGAGIMAGAGVALAVTARMLGAKPVGGAAAKHPSAGGGSASSGGSSSLSNPYQPQGGETHVTVVIGGEVVTRGVKTETRRQNLRGGITEGRMALAGS